MQMYAIDQGAPMLDSNSQPLFEKSWDIVVIGGGNAGLCAAITAAERGC